MSDTKETTLTLTLFTYLPLSPRFWLTLFSKLYVTFILLWIAFIFGRDKEED